MKQRVISAIVAAIIVIPLFLLGGWVFNAGVVALAALAAQGAYAVAQTSVPSNYWSAVQAFGEEVVAKTVTTANLQEKLTTMCNLIKTIKTE